MSAFSLRACTCIVCACWEEHWHTAAGWTSWTGAWAQPKDKVCKLECPEPEPTGKRTRDYFSYAAQDETITCFTLLRENSSFCWRSEHTEVTSGSRCSSQSTNRPEFRPHFVTSELLEKQNWKSYVWNPSQYLLSSNSTSNICRERSCHVITVSGGKQQLQG